MILENLRTVVLGLGISGESAAEMCARNGAQVTVYDRRTAPHFETSITRLNRYGVTFTFGADDYDLNGHHLVVRSPGIPAHHPVLLKAKAASIPVWSEIELAGRLTPCPIVAVTGTNGKGTTSELISRMHTADGRTTALAGNMGIPLAGAINTLSPRNLLVLEVSAGQLENTKTFAPQVAVITNIRPEHNNLYSWPTYLELKSRIVRNHDSDSWTIAPIHDLGARQVTANARGNIVYTSANGSLPRGVEGVYLTKNQLIARLGGHERAIMNRGSLKAPGTLPSVITAAAAAIASGAPDAAVQTAASTFNGREHTLEFVTSRNKITFINDAKSTNPWSLLHAINSFPNRPVMLIAGGDDTKQTDFTAVANGNLGPLSRAVLFGNSSTDLAAALSHRLPPADITVVDQFLEAITMAGHQARSGDVVIYSPGVYSPKAEPDYLTRGSLFKEFVLSL
ncbi:UDP-N-acetylmuramoylalanine--D-glutamate ligase [Kineosporia sp. NBRC 101677]|uniref:UDP-N-acetylmuramoyl-L-alanine--D-glutamate ligase n=1 Tax=Kineosporia sp. NBRC 101677 TaxID=3032197 RepID=UPI0024A32606|nr:UDP-N-acetylmuramoyl-L-alanine--D-glutamate ligase [Kineosporia sp. NBRC 101677]GLY19962.1 UDP-N-acetylmuramoylalanine--D-glutamate ligase [Kineosporia sp. NBRC 101677]